MFLGSDPVDLVFVHGAAQRMGVASARALAVEFPATFQLSIDLRLNGISLCLGQRNAKLRTIIFGQCLATLFQIMSSARRCHITGYVTSGIVDPINRVPSHRLVQV